MSPSHWIWLYCTFSSLKHTKFPSLNKKNPFSLPKSKIYSHQQQFIKRSIKTEQSWVQLIGAALCSSPSFSHGHLGKSIAHLWSKSKKGGEQECKHVVTRSINCFYCAMASASRAVTCGGLGGPDRVTEEIYATLSIKVQLRWTRAMWRRCESVCFMWRRHETAQSFSQSCWRGSFMQEVSFVGVTLSHGVVRWICRSQLITYLRVLFQNTQLILWKPRE